MATKDSIAFELDVDTVEAVRRFYTASTLKGVSESAIGKAIASRENPENGFAAKGETA